MQIRNFWFAPGIVNQGRKNQPQKKSCVILLYFRKCIFYTFKCYLHEWILNQQTNCYTFSMAWETHFNLTNKLSLSSTWTAHLQINSSINISYVNSKANLVLLLFSQDWVILKCSNRINSEISSFYQHKKKHHKNHITLIIPIPISHSTPSIFNLCSDLISSNVSHK